MEKMTLDFWIIMLLLFLAVFWGVFILLDIAAQPQNPLNGQIEPKYVLINNDSLLPISPVHYPDYKAYGVLVSNIVECESGGNHNGIWGKAGEYGIAQFMENTFYWMANEAKIKNPDWHNREQQLYLLDWALKNNLESHWTCWDTIHK